MTVAATTDAPAAVANAEPVSPRRSLLADAAARGAGGIPMALTTEPLGEFLGLSPTLLRSVELGPLPFASVPV